MSSCRLSGGIGMELYQMNRHPDFRSSLYIITMVAAIFTIMSAGATGIRAQGDCGCLPPSGKDIANSDSIVIDTCGLKGEWSTCVEAAHYVDDYTRLFARRWWLIVFDVDAVHLPAADRDSIVEIGWREIDTAYPDIRAGFEMLEMMFGPITLRKKYPDNATGDGSRIFRMRLQSYFRLDSVINLTRSIPHLTCDFDSELLFPSSVVASDGDVSRTSLDIRPNPARDRVRICFDRPATRRSLTITDIAGHSILASDATAEADGCVSLDVSSLAP
ncbi:MAG TPA: hypothetical protein VHI13_00030, partial [Candidatus Kapabacteria bacterium]|nr:hypothetical protein [Candidatus Kapabacteria bacterium]